MNITIDHTKQLKGIAILLVIIGHLKNALSLSLPEFITYAGAWGVSLFLILSGYGLTKSYLKNGPFLFKRFNILIPYSILTFIWIIVDILIFKKSYSIRVILLSLFGFDFTRSIDPSMWYISFILMWYTIFYIVFKLPIRNSLKLVILFLFSFLFKNYSLTRYTKEIAWQWQLHAYVFPIGVLSGLYSKYLSKLKITLFSSFLFFGMFFLFVNKSKISINYYSISNLLCAVGFIVSINVFTNKSKLFQFVGNISYEMYLLEGVFIYKFKLLTITSDRIISIFLYFVILIISSFILNYFVEKFLYYKDYVSFCLSKQFKI